jgi:hypothetical protein
VGLSRSSSAILLKVTAFFAVAKIPALNVETFAEDLRAQQ